MKNLKRILSVLLLVSMVLSMLPIMASAATATLDFGGGTGASQTTLSFTESASGITVVIEKGTHTNNAPYHATDHVRFYGTDNMSNTMTFTAPSGVTITGITFTVTSSSYPTTGLVASTGTMTDGAWSGSASSIVFTTTKQARIKTADITYTTSGDSGGSSSGGTTGGTIASGNYVIAALVDGTYYAMGTTLSSGKFGSSPITVTNGKVSAADAAGYTYTVTAVSGGYTIANGENYVAYNSSTNLKSTTDAYTWSITEGVNGSWRVASTATAGRGIVYRASTYKLFGGYALSNVTEGDTQYYDLEFLPVEGGSTATSYAVSWSTQGTGSGTVTVKTAGGTNVSSGAKVASGTALTVAITPDSGSTISSVTRNGTAQAIDAEGGAFTFTVSEATEIIVTFAAQSTPPATGDINGNYIIAAKVGDVYYAMSSTYTSKIAGKVITVTDGKVNPADAAGYIHTVTPTADGYYTIFNGTDYLGGGSSANLASKDSAYNWNISAGTNGTYRIASVDTATRGVVFRAASTSTEYYEFGFYSLSNVKAGSTEYFDIELIPVDGAAGGKTDTFVKVTSTDALGKGYYLIVYEEEGRIFDSSREDLVSTSTNTYQLVTIDGDKIVTSLDYAVSIDVSSGLDQATILTHHGFYMGRDTSSNGIDFSKEIIYTNSISINDDGSAAIMNQGGKYLRYNNSSSTEAFRYYLATSVKSVALYKSQNYVPGVANVTISWSEVGEAAGNGSIVVKDASGKTITSGATITNGTKVTMTLTPNEGYRLKSVKINDQYAEVDEAGGNVTFDVTENTTIEVTWEEIILESVDVDLKIISGAGKIVAYRNGEQIGSFEGIGGQSGKLDQTVYVGETVKLAIYPGEAQRLVSVENGGRRVNKNDIVWDATLGAYTCEVEITGGSEAIGFSFLPRKSDIGVIAILATSFEPGKYVITGTTFDPTEGNSFDTKETYLLFGCDDLLASGADTIGRKAAALNLYEAGITIEPSAPYTMEGQTKGSLYDIQPYEDTGYYTMQICGMTETYYLAARDSNELRAVTEVNDFALWSVEIDSNGIATILNKATGRILKFNAAADNNQFRAYKTTLAGKYYLPVLYKAIVSGYQVSYDKEGLGTVTAYNNTSSTSVASGSIQNEHSSITFQFTAAQYNTLEKVTVNGVDYTSQVVNDRLTIDDLSQNINVHAVFSNVVISNDITIKYFVNGVEMETVEIKDLSVFSIVPDLSRSVTVNGKTYKYSDLSFEYSENKNTGAMYSNPNDAIQIDDGHVIHMYFLTSPVALDKTAVEITKTSTDETNLGGDDSADNFTTENNQDSHGNVHQTYEITLSAQSSNWMESYTTGGNTDIIVILDNSLSMYDATEDGTNASILNKTVLLNALQQFLNTVFIDAEAGNRVSLITYHTTAYLHNSSYPNGYRKNTSLPSAFTYANTFMTNKNTILNLAKNAMDSEDDVDAALSNDGGTTNPESALMLAKQVAALRTGDKAKRDVIVIMFTDGKPTSRLTNEYDYTFDSTGDGTRWSGGNETSSREYNETLAAGLALKKYFNNAGCKSTIYSVALLNALEASSNVSKYYKMVGYLYGAGTAARQWVGVQDASIVPNVNTSSNWKKVTGFSDVYKPIYTNQVNVQTALSDLFESIAYTVVPGKYVSIHGSVVDVIPPQFVLTQESMTQLQNAGWTITTGSNGTTISHPDFPATYEGNSVSYQIECIDGGYGAVFTNSSATFTYTDVQTDKPVSANFYKPTVEIIPWTVDDHGVAQLKTDLVLDIIANDLFGEYTAGGHTIEDYTVTLTDKDGNPATYMNSVEQNGDPSTYFDAVLDQNSGTVTFYTVTSGSYEFYYVVAATVVKPDGSKEIVYSRVTPVDVVIPNVDLFKTAQEVTNNESYSSLVTADDYGNEHQLYLITLKAQKQNKEDKIYNGILTDRIPADFEFVKFVSPASNSNLKHENGVITWTGISSTDTGTTDVVTLQFLVKYTGKGYGTAFTNTSANFSYNFGSSTGPAANQYFPVPTAGLNPSTVNDLDIAHSGDTNTLNVLTNDIFDEDGFELPNYPASDVTVIITDENGNPIADPEAYYGMEITVNEDGTITYTAPEDEGPVQFYYVVQSTVTTPLGSTYAEDNSTTLQSRPTMVTVYTITDKYLVVDYGYKTDALSLLPDSDVVIDKKSGAKLSDYITFETPTVNGAYGTAAYETLTNDVTFAYSPKTTDFYATDNFPTSLSTTKSTYVTVEREIASGVTVIPANNLFFEENFINFGTYTVNEDAGGKSTEGVGTWDQGDWVVEGEEDKNRTQGTANIIYGYDDAYKTGEAYSGGSSMAVTVKPTLEENGSMYGDQHGYFTFTGTGFDIYATCSRDTGVLIAEVYAYDEEKEYGLGQLMRVVLIDTYMDGGEGVVFDQLPVVMCHDLRYARYTVKLRAYYHAMFDHAKPDARAVRKVLNLGYDVPLEIQTLDTSNAKPTTRSLPAAADGQYNVYVDSVRIYNPLTNVPTEVIANKAYNDANEINAHFTVLRDLLMDAGDWNAEMDSSVVNGVLYIADERAGKLNGGESGTITDDMTVPAPKVDGFYLNPTGRMKTVVENGKTYLIDTDDEKASYDGSDIYIVYIKNAEEDGGEDTVDYVSSGVGNYDRIGYRYEKDGKELELHPSKLAELNIVHYVSNYEAFGPKYEVHLTNGNGIAFAIPNQAHAQISAKMADNGSAQLYAYYTKNGKLDWYPVATVTSRTEMYYDLTACIEAGMLIVKCVSDDPNAILSLCTLKTSGEDGGVAPTINPKGIIRAAFAFAGKGDALEETETVLDGNITIGQQLFLESDLTMNFRIKEALLSGYDMSTAYLTVEQDFYPTGAAKQTETLTIRDFKAEDGVLIFSYNGIAAAQMNDEMRVVLHIEDAMGNTYESPVLTTSITLYAENLLEAYGAENEKLATLVMDMLNYGTAAQSYFGRHADAPANKAYPIFADFASFATAEPAALENLFTETENEGAVAKVGIALELSGRVGIAYRVNLPVDIAAYDAVLEIRDAEGELLQSISLKEATEDASGRYVVCYNGSVARQMRDVVYATVTVNGEAISNTYGYSISTYAAQVAGATDGLAKLTRLMVTYGDAAKAYFG